MEHDRLMPWLVLIVLADDEFDPKEVVHSYGRLPSIKVAGKYLPNLDDSWAWAHTQIAASGEAYGGSDEEVKSNVTKVVTNEPHRDLSRLLCPRQLVDKKNYTAYLVPSYKRGREVGLGNPVVTISREERAWKAGSGDEIVELPVYFNGSSDGAGWRFQDVGQ